MTALETLQWRGPHGRDLSLALNRDYDTRWMGELPIIFEGSAAECVLYAAQRGYEWKPDDSLLLGGRFEHPLEPLILYPL